MANYVLTNTADDINTAIGKALNPDSNLTGVVDNDPSLVTSGAVKTYVDTKTTNISTDISNIQTDLATKTKAAVFTNQGAQAFTTNPTNISGYGYETVSLVSKVDADFASLSNNQITLSSGNYLVSFGFVHRFTNSSVYNTYIAWYFKDVNSSTGDNATPFYDQIFFLTTYGGLGTVAPVSSGSGRNVWNSSDRNTISSQYLSLDSNLTFQIEMARARTNINVEMKDLHLVFVKL